MNVFVIPSWYPNKRKKTSGIFVKEQIDAVSEYYSNVNHLVSTWGHSMSDLSLKDPKSIFSSLVWRLKQKNGIYKDGNNSLVFAPTLNWSKKVPFGGFDRLLKVNRKNFQAACSKVGKIDIIHAHACYPAGYIASIIAKETGVPYILTEHMGPFPFPSLLKDNKPNSLVNEAINSADAVIAVSPSLSRRMEQFGFKKPIFIPNLVNESLFFPNNKREKSNKFRFLTVGNLSPKKGIDVLLKAIASWKSMPQNVEFIIVGGGRRLDAYKELASSLGISNFIQWMGEVDRKPLAKLMQSADAFVLPSRHETFGIVFCEAIAAGIPVIATKCGGPELFVDELNGLLIDIDDNDGLVSALIYMYNNAVRYNSAELRQSIVSKYSREIVAQEIVKIYNSVLESHHL